MRIALVLAYDGFAYNGWQSQPDGNTIQDHLETALSQLSHEAIKVIGAGRTDAGVSARAMVAHFDTNRHLETWKWVRGTNTYLPYDIRVLKAIEVDEAFHARFDSKVKTYRYTIDRRGNNPFSFHFADQCFLPLDVEKMSDAATVFLGTHDFTSFNSSDPSLNMIRTVHEVLQQPVYAVFGGTHLVEADEARIEATVKELQNLGMSVLGLCHCSGALAEDWMTCHSTLQACHMAVGDCIAFE